MYEVLGQKLYPTARTNMCLGSFRTTRLMPIARKTSSDGIRTVHRTHLDLTTPHVANACMRLGIAVRCAPAGIVPMWNGTPDEDVFGAVVMIEGIGRREVQETLKDVKVQHANLATVTSTEICNLWLCLRTHRRGSQPQHKR